MSGTTISQSYVNGVSLTNANYNPVTILAGVTISAPAAPGLAASGTATQWIIANSGTVQSNGTSLGSYGIVLQGGGTVTNNAGGLIGGGYGGVVSFAAGTVVNHGTMTAGAGTIGDGVALIEGGEVGNGAGGVITGANYGVLVKGAVVAVSNAGGVRGANGGGVLATAGAFVVNGTAGGIAGYHTGVSILGSGSVVNNGSIGSSQTSGTGYYYNSSTKVFTALTGGVIMDTGGVDNQAGATIDSAFFAVVAAGVASVVNDGQIDGSSTIGGFGIFLQAGGNITNASSASIVGGNNGVAIGGASGATLLNAGSIGAVSHFAVQLSGTAGYVGNAATGTIASGYTGVLFRGADGQIVNDGSIAGGETSIDCGIELLAGGTVTNAASATISAGTGVLVEAGVGTVTNSGSIVSTERLGTIEQGAGIELKGGGLVTNGAGADVNTQLFGVQIYGAGTVFNRGTILANDSEKGYGAGVWIKGNAEVSNASGGTISGGLFATVFYDQFTLTNAGVITGTATAVSAPAGFADRIIDEPGATFSGIVSGGNALTSSIASTLELAAGPSVGSIAGMGSRYIDLRDIAIDRGASWSVGGTIAAAQTISFAGPDTTLTFANPGSVSGEIIGFSAADTIVLAGVTGVTSATLNITNQLTVVPGSGPDLTLEFDPTQTFSGTNFNFIQVGGDTDLTIPCFAAGTRIATAWGEVAVERLRVGDRVLTRRGALLDVAWIGHRRVDCRGHKRPLEVWPVRVRAGAFGGAPHRDLLLSPDHAVFVDGVLIPVRYLINGATIAQEAVDEITYWHVELARHDVLLAEGLPCESYLDTGNRETLAQSSSPSRRKLSQRPLPMMT